MENGRKKLRFEILLERYFTNFHRILLTNLMFAVPSVLFFSVFYLLTTTLFHGKINIPFLLLAMIPLYPFYAGVVMVCRNIARGDKDVSVPLCFFKAVKENFLPFLLHGVIVYVITMLSTLAISLYINMLSVSWFFYVLLFFSIIIALLLLYVCFYVPLMNLTYDLPLKYVYKNSFLMSFGELKNNFFATFALAIVFGICFTVTAFSGTTTVLLIIAILLWALLLPATCTFMYVYYIYEGMTNMMQSKEERDAEKSGSIKDGMAQKAPVKHPPVEEDDLSSIDISTLKDTDDYIFHNGRMVKQSTLLRMAKEQQEKKSDQ